MKWIFTELKRFFNRPSLYLVAAVFAVCLAAIAAVVLNGDSQTKSRIYGVYSYSTFEELATRIEDTKAQIDELKYELEYKTGYGMLYDDEKEQMEYQIDTLRTSLSAMQALYRGQIPYENAYMYGDYSPNNGTGAVGLLIAVAGWALAAVFSIRLAVKIPAEIKESQAKLTLTMPSGRVKYALYQLLFSVLACAICYLAAIIFSAVLCAAMFPVKGVCVVYAMRGTAFCTGFATNILLNAAAGLFAIAACCAVAFALSLFIFNRGVTAVLTIALCFTGQIFSYIQRYTLTKFTRWLLPCNLNVLQYFGQDYGANNAWLAVIFIAVICIIFVPLALIKFNRQDIK